MMINIFLLIVLNYVEHAKETGAKTPENPVLFNKSVHSIIAPTSLDTPIP